MGVVPIFLLDDIFGELDIKRSVKISEYLKDLGQAFITVTDFTNLSFIKRDNVDMYINLSRGVVVNG
jgi:recombinational DNA repair ATPase RecF